MEQASTVQTKATSSEITKPPSPHDEIFVDFCSYKDVPGNYYSTNCNHILFIYIYLDNYADVMNPEEINNITSILFGNVPKTPPPKRGDIFEPNYIENNNYKVSNHMDYDTDIEIIASMNLCGLDMFNITEPPSPVFDFL